MTLCRGLIDAVRHDLERKAPVTVKSKNERNNGMKIIEQSKAFFQVLRVCQRCYCKMTHKGLVLIR